MKLGAFSVSLAVKNLKASRKFYETLGFTKFHGEPDQGWVIMANGDTKIGLFQGMFENNILTFNPGWDAGAVPLDQFMDIRDIQKALKADGLDLLTEADEKTSGPASLVMVDPDGNQILIDQHV